MLLSFLLHSITVIFLGRLVLCPLKATSALVQQSVVRAQYNFEERYLLSTLSRLKHSLLAITARGRAARRHYLLLRLPPYIIEKCLLFAPSLRITTLLLRILGFSFVCISFHTSVLLYFIIVVITSKLVSIPLFRSKSYSGCLFEYFIYVNLPNIYISEPAFFKKISVILQFQRITILTSLA